MTAKIAKVLIVMLVLATALLAGNTLIRNRVDDTKAIQAGTCCQGGNIKACLPGSAELSCQAQKQAQTCPVACPKCCCPQCCCDEPCCLSTKGTTGCSTSQQKSCCASK